MSTSAPAPNAPASHAPAELLEVFLLEGWDTLAQMEAEIEELRAASPVGDAPRHATLSLLAHRLRGSAGLYGFPQLAALAAVAERLTESRPQLRAAAREQLLDVLELVTLGLRRALNDVSSGRNEGEVGLHFARVGGASRLQALLRAEPLAFAPRTRRPAHPDDQGAPPAPQPDESQTQTTGPHPGGMDAELQAFAQQNTEVWSYFAPEVREYLETLRAGLDRRGPDAGEAGDDAVTVMFRAAHTIKGSAFMVGLPVMGQLAHTLEDLLDAVRGGGLPLHGAASALLGEGVTLLERMLLSAEGQAGLLDDEVAGLGARSGALVRGELPGHETPGAAEVSGARYTPPVAPGAQSVRVGTERLDAIMDGVGQLVMARARLERQLTRLAELESSLQTSQARVARVVHDFEERHLNPDLARAAGPGAGALPSGDDAPSGVGATVSELFEDLEFDRYDDLNILARSVGELSADLHEWRQQFHRGAQALRGESDTFLKLLRGLRSDVARTRRVPVSQAYTRPRRWTRGQAQADLVTLGGDLEIDAFLTQGLAEVLMHLVTNAYTHAFTPGDAGRRERAQLGKPQIGQVVLEARRHGALLDLTVRDDGHGIRVQQVRERALQGGLRSARELADLSDADALRLIFLPGLSTAEQLTTEAGRGVGMDIVASTVRRLGGELLVDSTPGEGTTFTVRLPLTQQVMDLLTVRIGPHRLAFPAAAIVTLLEGERGQLRGAGTEPMVPPAPGDERKARESLLDGTPLYCLQPLWGLPAPTEQLKVLVLRTPAGPVAFAVDEFGDIAEAVVSPPGPLLGALDYVSGSTLTPDGEPVLLPDTAGLIRQASRAAPGAAAVQPVPRAGGATRGRLLLIDDSLSVRRVVSRMLERAGYEVRTASDGQEALDLLRADSGVLAVLTDLEMPRVNGFEVIEEVRRRGLNMPVVVMTTRAGDKHQRLAFQLGASDYFSKPVDEALLLRCLERLTVPAGQP